MKQILVLLMFVFFGVNAFTQNTYRIIPQPSSISYTKGYFAIDKSTEILTQYKFGLYIPVLIKELYNKKFNTDITICDIHKYDEGKKTIQIELLQNDSTTENYTLKITPKTIYLTGGNKGLYYAYQTLVQLITNTTNNKLKCGTITDAPRFAYRGLHLDVARHFQPISYIKQYLDNMARYKYNTFHWHLTDDQGWRIEIKKYPKLTTIGGYRNGTLIGRYPGTGNTSKQYGGYYTQAEIKEIVQYAAERYITVLPEIEMPGHASAAIAAYPELSCYPTEPTIIPSKYISEVSKKVGGKLVQETWGVFEDVFAPTDYTFNFLQNVIDEVLPLFPSNYIHIGGDECPKENWKRSPYCQQLIIDNNLKDEHGLQSYFIQRIEKYINSKGKQIIGWDEILEGGLAPNATVMSWRGEKGGIEAAKQQHNVIMTPGSHCYLDHSQTNNEDSITIGGYLPIEKIYAYNPVPKELTAAQSKYILGAQGNLWTEYIPTQSKLEYMLYPRMVALSEVLWSSVITKNWNEFEPRLLNEINKLKYEGVNVSDALFKYSVKILPSIKKGEIKLTFKNNESKINIGSLINVKQYIEKDTIITFKNEARIPNYKNDPNWTKCLFKDTISNITDTSKLLSIHEIKDEKNIYINLNSRLEITQFHGGCTGYKLQDLCIQFNKATAQKITLDKEPSKSYPGNGGAFGLVNGVLSSKGIQSSEWLGFNGTDADIVIDMGKVQQLTKVAVHTLNLNGSWIYLPNNITLQTSSDGITYTTIATTTNSVADANNMYFINTNFAAVAAKYIKLKVFNYGTIPTGSAGAGNKAWLFIDEVQVY